MAITRQRSSSGGGGRKFNRSEGPGGGPGGGYRRGRSSGPRKKINKYFVVFPERNKSIDYKDSDRLLKFLTEKGRIIPRRITGLTAKQQRELVRAIKRARHAGLLAFQAN